MESGNETVKSRERKLNVLYDSICVNYLSIVHDFECTWAGVEGAMLHNDVRIKTQFDKLNLIPSSELESLITISYDTKIKNNRINLTNAPFSVTEDPFRWALEDCKKNINRGKKILQNFLSFQVPFIPLSSLSINKLV